MKAGTPRTGFLFCVTLFWRLFMSVFAQTIYQWVARIPSGCVVTYGQLAALAGRPRCARQVGRIMSACPAYLPWHRVLKKDGTFPVENARLLAYTRLKEEGVPFTPDGRVDISACRMKV